ncbi:MAG: 5-(carboxyamino)imidazole ribonucleotide mutase [Proteobacteria bacterium]|nr:5-(carboxyamino)imidazole ribonucleotide mutase [Pseudomonadota bacterium]
MTNTRDKDTRPLVGVCMGSQSDWAVMRHASEMLAGFGVVHANRIISAHRTPQRLSDYATSAHTHGIKVIIAGAGGAAHLPGMLAAHTHLPILGVPIANTSLDGLDSLLSIVQMPKGVPVATLAIGEAGAVNAALLAVAILSLSDTGLAKQLSQWRETQTAKIADTPNPTKSPTES